MKASDIEIANETVVSKILKITCQVKSVKDILNMS